MANEPSLVLLFSCFSHGKQLKREISSAERHIFLCLLPVLYVEKGDLITLVGGVLLVLVIALVLHPEYLSSLSTAPAATPVPTPAVPPTAVNPYSSLGTPVVTTETPLPEPTIAPPYQISYSNDPFSYPRFKMPDNLDTFGAGDAPLRGKTMIPFAFVAESRGGLTQKFHVPYGLWVINTTVIANRTPQYGNFKMVLCYAGNGTVIDGEEILNRGSMIRNVEVSGTDFYMIISTAYIDRYYISLETPMEYYFTAPSS